VIIGHVRTLCPYAALILASFCAACADRPTSRGSTSASAARPDTAIVYLAASLTRPLEAALDTFATRYHVVIQRESGASLEHARKITDLRRVPDVIALADVEVFPQLLMPQHVSWYAEFARNRMVVAYTDRSRYAERLDTSTWTSILARRDVEVGRPDPDLAPAGYRAILLLRLAERYYGQPGLASRIVANSPRNHMRANAAELAALLQAHELDYVFDYESVAIAYGLRYLRLPADIDLGDPSRATTYASESVMVRGNRPGGDSIVFAGRPIVYALAVPVAAPHARAGTRLAAFLLSDEGRRLMRAAHVDAMDRAIFVGTRVPDTLRDVGTR
jgi:molybdate/tungstate transport system substrate-binding protein